MSSSTIKRALSNTAIIPVLATILCLLPFAGKAFHIDDPMYIWAAKQIQTSPADFFGFSVNWYGTDMPMAEVNKNPPGVSYYIAFAALLLGWSEFALHIAFLIPAVAVAAGTYYLARQFCSRPVLAALAAVLTPGFLVSSTNIMSDTMMLALWVWAIVLWLRGIKTNQWLSLLAGGILIATCALTKYFGIALLPLLFVYSLLQKRRVGLWLLFLLIPIAILLGYQWATHVVYGRGLLSDAASFATEYRGKADIQFFSKVLTALAFTGGCLITNLFYIPLLWSRRSIALGILLTILLVFVLTSAEKIGSLQVRDDDGVRWDLLIQLALMAAAGVSLLGLAGADLSKHRNVNSLLLLLWVFGTFTFAGFVNWVVNARSILPMLPAAGILLARRFDHRAKVRQQPGIWQTIWPLIPATIVGLAVTWADYTWANTARSQATTIHKRFENYQGTVWFQGHWGFQHYMEANGHKALDFKRSRLAPGDIIIIPSNNCFTRLLPSNKAHLAQTLRIASSRWLAIMNSSLGAGFYSDIWGPLPFAVGPVAPEGYYIFIIK